MYYELLIFIKSNNQNDQKDPQRIQFQSAKSAIDRAMFETKKLLGKNRFIVRVTKIEAECQNSEFDIYCCNTIN